MATLEAPPRPRLRLHEGPFVTEPFFDFSREDSARRMRAAIEKVRGQLGREYDLIIGGEISEKLSDEGGFLASRANEQIYNNASERKFSR